MTQLIDIFRLAPAQIALHIIKSIQKSARKSIGSIVLFKLKHVYDIPKYGLSSLKQEYQANIAQYANMSYLYWFNVYWIIIE